MADIDTEKKQTYEDELTNPNFQRMLWFRVGPDGGMFSLKMNPVVSLVSAAIIWGFVGWACHDPDGSSKEFSEWKTWVAEEWSWLYIASQNIWVCVLAWILFSKYRHIKLGRDDEKPEYSNASWFAMLFSCGVAVGLFYYSVAEPMWHYRGWGGARWMELDDNTRATHAMMVTWYHWGIHGWIPYTVVGAIMALMSYRRDFPMTIRFCFYPLIGEQVYGPLGDCIDILSIVATLFGVCTSLGLGCMQINTGLLRLDRGFYRGVNSNPEGRIGVEYDVDNQIAIIWCITALATLSVISGIKYGIRRLSEICFCLGMFLLLCVMFMGDTMYIINFITQTFGYLIWYLPKISWQTDAFELLGPAPDGRGGGAGWMDAWTLFYWGWWISWGPFVGLFMAKISRGRTLGEFILGTLFVPSLYSFLWLGTFGAEGIAMDRRAEAEGLDCGDWSGDISTIFSTETTNIRLWCQGTTDIYFDQLSSYGDKSLADFLSVVSIIALTLYFITSSDSGSLVIDILAANGVQEPPMLQRIFWAFTEGATATALLYSGGADALNALQTVSIVSGLVYTFILFWMTQALVIACKEEAKDIAIDRPTWSSFFLAINHGGASSSMVEGITNIAIAAVVPFVPLGRVLAQVWNGFGAMSNMIYTAVGATFWVAIIIFISLKGESYNWMMVSAVLYVMFSALMAAARMCTRDATNCQTGDPITDFLTCMCFYPLALAQMEAEIKKSPVGVAVAGASTEAKQI